MLDRSRAFVIAVCVFLIACKGSADKQPPASSPSAPSSKSSAPASGPPSDLCKLATKADVEKAFGGSVADGVATEDHCQYAISGTLKSGMIVNDKMGGYIEISWNEHVMDKKSKVAIAMLEPVPGFDNAWYEKQAHALMVEAHQGELQYQAVLSLATMPSNQPADADLAKPALIELATATYARPN